MLTDSLRERRNAIGTRRRRLDPGRQALLVLAHLLKGETYADLAGGFASDTTSVFPLHPRSARPRRFIHPGGTTPSQPWTALH